MASEGPTPLSPSTICDSPVCGLNRRANAAYPALAGGFGHCATSGHSEDSLGLGVLVGISLPYGRAQESEADRFGLELMAKAGFDPAQAIPLWQNMSAATGGKTRPQLLSTHPSNKNRIAELQAAQPLYRQAKAGGLAPQCKAQSFISPTLVTQPS